MTVLPPPLYFAAGAPYSFGVALGFARARWRRKQGSLPVVLAVSAFLSVILSAKILEAYNVVLSIQEVIVWPGEYVLISFLLGVALGNVGEKRNSLDNRL